MFCNRLCAPEDDDIRIGSPSLPDAVDDVRRLARGGRETALLDAGVSFVLRDSPSSLPSIDSYRGGSTGNHDESSLIGFSIHDIVLAFVSDESLSLRRFLSRFFGRRRDISCFLASSIPDGLKVSSSPNATQSPPSIVVRCCSFSGDASVVTSRDAQAYDKKLQFARSNDTTANPKSPPLFVKTSCIITQMQWYVGRALLLHQHQRATRPKVKWRARKGVFSDST